MVSAGAPHARTSAERWDEIGLLRHRGPSRKMGLMSDEKAAARIGIRAANAAATSMYASITAAICAFIPFVGGAALIGALIAIVYGLWSFVLVGRYKLAMRGIEVERGLGVVAIRRAKRAPEQAGAGILVGIGILCWQILVLFLSK